MKKLDLVCVKKKKKRGGSSFVKAKVIFQVICRTELLLPVKKIEGKKSSEGIFHNFFFFHRQNARRCALIFPDFIGFRETEIVGSCCCVKP